MRGNRLRSYNSTAKQKSPDAEADPYGFNSDVNIPCRGPWDRGAITCVCNQ